MNKLIITTVFSILSFSAFCQETETEKPTKHYMPLFLDIPAEMNVEIGFKEVNIAGGYADFEHFSGVRTLIEYDFAPIDKLGFEIEVPFIFVNEKHSTISEVTEGEAIEGATGHAVSEEGSSSKSSMAIRIGFNYALFNDKKSKTSLAVGYFNEFELTHFKEFGKPLLEGNVYNPFLAVAKIWGERFHSMIYTGPAISQSFEHDETNTAYRFNTILSYRFGKGEKESFAGIECNQTWANEASGQMVLRPQVQLVLTEKWKLGIVGSIPVATSNELNGSGFLRIIYSPK